MPESLGSRETLRVLVIGYSGANNTGAEALLLADMEDLRAVLGPRASFTVPSLDIGKLRRYLPERPGLKILRIPSVFFATVWRLMKQHDALVLVEGSTFMDSWGSALLWYFLWAAWCARRQGKPCLAYAVDAGELCARNRFLTRRVASRMDLIVVRSRAAAGRLRACGVGAPIESTADNALTFTPDSAQASVARSSWPEAGGALVGLAVVNFHLFPVRLRPFAPKADLYRWPYAFSRSRDRRNDAAALAAAYADVADWIVAEQKRPVALICMEELDGPFAEAVREQMRHGDRARIFSARDLNASQMTGLLRSLELLVTARYHAAVLSLAAAVPQIAVGHDFRLRALYDELGLQLFVDPNAPSLVEMLKGHIRNLLSDPEPTKAALRRGYEELAARARRNREHLRAFFSSRGWTS